MNLAVKFIMIFLTSFNLLNAQQTVSISELERKINDLPKNIVIEFYTDWCGICAIQQKKIEKDERLISMLENEFYFVKFNAESKESFILNGIEFENKENKIHDFAKAISGDSNLYPGWAILNPKFEIIFQYNGLLDEEDLKYILLKLR